MAQSEKAVRVQLVGDVGVGKTSLILSLISEEFFDARCLSGPSADDVAFCQTTDSSLPGLGAERCDRLASTCEDILIPAEITITRTPCLICDLAANSSDDAIRQAIRHADVVCIVYSCTYEQSKLNIANRWIPLLLRANEETVEQDEGGGRPKPAIIVASKCDLSSERGIVADTFIDTLIEQHDWIHCRIECSALRMHNIAELFYYAQKVVLYPVDRLFDCTSKRLRDEFQLALKHIFHILDRRLVGRLDDDALNRLQQLAVARGYVRPENYRSSLASCNEAPTGLCKSRADSKLTSEDFDLLKKLLTSSDESAAFFDAHDHSHAKKRLDHNEITEYGFLCLFGLLLQRDLSETVWALLQVFFDGDLRFHSRDEQQLQWLQGSAGRPVPVKVELTDDALDFIRSLYEEHKRARQRALTWPSAESIRDTIFKFLEPAPNHLELRYNVRRADNSEYVSEEQFLLWWMYQVHSEPCKTLLWLSQLGFDFWMTQIDNNTTFWCPSSFAVSQGNSNASDRQTTSGREPFVCTIFAEPKELANLLLRDLAKRTMPNGVLQDWLVCSLGKCEHCAGCKKRALILKSVKRCHDVDNTHCIRSSHLLILICDLVDEDSCQQVLNLCCTLGTSHGTDTASANNFRRLSADGQPGHDGLPRLLLVAVNNDRCGENSVHVETINRMKAICPNLCSLPLTFSSKQLLNGQWADRIFHCVKHCLADASGKASRGRPYPGSLTLSFLSLPNSLLTSTHDFLCALATRLRLFEQPQAALDRLRLYGKDRRALYSCYWYVMLSTSAVFGCIAVMLLKHFGRRSISSGGITRSVFI